MNSKKCNKCNQIKLIDEFHKNSTMRDGLQSVCKLCCKKYHKQEKVRALKRQYRESHRKEIQAAWNRKYYKDRNFQKEVRIRAREHYYANREKKLIYAYQYRQKHKKEAQVYQSQYYEINKEKLLTQHRLYCHSHREELLTQKKAYQRKRRREDPKYRLNSNIRNAIGKSLKGNKGGAHWEDLVGYSLKQLKHHLKRLFKPHMTWENYGRQWQVDHIIPIAVHNFTSFTHPDFKKCWALKNLQPLDAEENNNKNAKLINTSFQPSLQI